MSLRVGFLGLGEAGAALAADLVAAGCRVRGWDPVPRAVADGVEVAGSALEAAAHADAVVSVNSAAAAADAASSVAAALRPDSLFADLNTASPRRKREVAALVATTGALFADVALLGPVVERGLRTPALVSGPGAERFARAFGSCGMPVTVLGPEVGDAAARKLVRSVFAKGLAAAIGESLAAAELLGCEPWLRAEVERTLTDADAALARRLVEGSRVHAVRRTEEMAAAADLLRELGVEPRVASAAQAWLAELASAPIR